MMIKTLAGPDDQSGQVPVLNLKRQAGDNLILPKSGFKRVGQKFFGSQRDRVLVCCFQQLFDLKSAESSAF
jgi:hypothetical protein